MTSGGGGGHGCTEQGHLPATDRRGRDDDAPPHSAAPFPFPEAALEMKKKQKQGQEPSPEIPDNAFVEILSRVPYRSLCRFKCVSKPWLALCSDPDIRRRCPQTLSGFFYNRSSCGLSFRNLSGRGPPPVDPSLPFLRGRYERVEIQQCCGGLLLCRCWESYKGRNKKKFGYAVCNPATGEWTVLTLRPRLTERDRGGFERINPARPRNLARAGRPICFTGFAQPIPLRSPSTPSYPRGSQPSRGDSRIGGDDAAAARLLLKTPPPDTSTPAYLLRHTSSVILYFIPADHQLFLVSLNQVEKWNKQRENGTFAWSL